nr:hypothetical protein [Tanacetum cinerariifolium]
AVSETVSAAAVVPAAVSETVSAVAVVPTAASVKVAIPSTRRRKASKEHIEEEENKAIASINETPAQKAAKRRRVNEEAEDV